MGGHFTFAEREEGGFLVDKEILQIKKWWTECDSLGTKEATVDDRMRDRRRQDSRALIERVLAISLLGCWR